MNRIQQQAIAAKAQPSGGRKLTRAEAARHASLVRWKKEQPFAANVQERLAQIRAARVKKGKGKGKGKGKAAPKPKQTPEQRKAEKAQAQAQQRETTLKESGLGEDARASLDDLMAGRDVEDDGGLEKMGLAERDKDGKLRLTAAGRSAHRAAGRGDAGTVKDALSKGKEALGKKAERDKAKADRLAKQKGRREKRKAKPQEERPAAPDPEKAQRQKERSEDRAAAQADRAQRNKERAEDRATRQKEHAEDRAERAKDRAEQRKQRAEDRAQRAKDRADKDKEKAKQNADKGADVKKKRRQEAEAEVQRILAARTRKSMDTLTPILDDMQATIAELAEVAAPEIKAGRRNSTADQSQIDAGYEMAMQLCDIFEGLGADTGEEEDGEGEPEGMDEEMMEGKAETWLGDAVKMADDDTVYGPAVWLNGTPDTPDLSERRDYFTKSTEFWLDEWERRPMLWHHNLDESDILDTMRREGASVEEVKAMAEALEYLDTHPVIGTWTKATVDPIAVWLKGQTNKAHRYRGAIKHLIDSGLIRISTDSAPHLVKRERQRNGTHEIKRWPFFAASLTTTAAEPRLLDVQAVKSIYDAAGIQLPFAIDNPEAPTGDGERLDAAKAEADRARRLSLQLKFIQLQE